MGAYKLWINPDNEGRIVSTILKLGDDPPKNHPFVIENLEIISELRKDSKAWYIENNELKRKAEISILIVQEKSASKPYKANGIDEVVIKFNGVPNNTNIKVKIGYDIVEVPFGEDLNLTSIKPTPVVLSINEVKYRASKDFYLEFI